MTGTPIFFARAERLAARRVAGEMVVLSADDSSLYVLNELGTLIWEAADGRTPLDALVAGVICREFEVDEETGRRDAEAFIRDLAAHGVVTVSDEPIAAGGEPAEGA